jgi:pyruvate/2-oxoglutarate dehydrogenase complex dihydrolipoamide acyltransferase (E2) component
VFDESDDMEHERVLLFNDRETGAAGAIAIQIAPGRGAVAEEAQGAPRLAAQHRDPAMVNLILGWDHRALDGIYAAQFLTALGRRLEAPA